MKNQTEKPLANRKHQDKPSARILPAKKNFTVLDYAHIQGISKATAYRTLESMADKCEIVRVQEKNKFGHIRNIYTRLSDWVKTYNTYPSYKHKKLAQKMGLSQDLAIDQGKLL